MVLKVTLKLKEEPDEIVDIEGQTKNYMLRELTGSARDTYLTGMTERMKFDDKGKPSGLKSFDGIQSSLLSKTLYDENNNLVTVQALNSFPASALSALFEHSQALSALDLKEDGKEEEKND